jgi:F0F1-type ATP synthase membrane subunit b/b'
LLLQQAAAFLILVAILRKFVYPVLIKSIDDRRKAPSKKA